MLDLTTAPPPPPPRLIIKTRMTPEEVSDSMTQIDLWSRSTRTYLNTLRDAVAELQEAVTALQEA